MPTDANAAPAEAPSAGHADLPPPRPLTLRPNDLAARLGTSTRNLYLWMKHPDPDVRLPKPFKIGKGSHWRLDEIEAWLERQAQRRS